MSISTHQLLTTQAEDSIIGCQLRYRHAIERCQYTLQRADGFYYRLNILGEMIEQLRERLRTSWRTKSHCSRNNPKCRRGSCGCSYRDLVELWGCLQSYRRVSKQFDETMHLYRDLRLLCTHIIQPRLATLLVDDEARRNFVDTLVCLDELTDDERWVFHNVCGEFSGGAVALTITIGNNDDVVKTWKFDYW